jgi:hypothetical protein
MEAMLAAMSEREFSAWRTLFDIEPWGEAHLEKMVGHLIAAIDRFHRASGSPLTPEQYTELVRQLRDDNEPRKTVEDEEVTWDQACKCLDKLDGAFDL